MLAEALALSALVAGASAQGMSAEEALEAARAAEEGKQQLLDSDEFGDLKRQVDGAAAGWASPGVDEGGLDAATTFFIWVRVLLPPTSGAHPPSRRSERGAGEAKTGEGEGYAGRGGRGRKKI